MADTTTTEATDADNVVCVREADENEDTSMTRRYHYTEMYVLYSVATFAAFLVLVLVPRILLAPCRKKR